MDNIMGYNDELRNFPIALQQMFIGLTEQEFRCDISSTEIRNSQPSKGVI